MERGTVAFILRGTCAIAIPVTVSTLGMSPLADDWVNGIEADSTNRMGHPVYVTIKISLY